MSARAQLPRWMRELQRYLPIKTQFCFYGNIYDRLLYPIGANSDGEPRYAHLTLREFFTHFLREQGYELIGFYDLADGLTIVPATMQGTFDRLRGAEISPTAADPDRNNSVPVRPLEAAAAIRNLLANRDVPCAFVIESASRLSGNAGQLLQEEERVLFLRLMKAAQNAARVRVRDKTVNNCLALVCDQLADLPSWMYLNNPCAKTIEIGLPGPQERGTSFDLMRDGFAPGTVDTSEIAKIRSTFVELTQGLKLYELESVRILSLRESLPLARVREAIERFKYGVTESPWDALDLNRFQHAEETLRQRVKGQDEAILKVVDILKRARLGLSGAQMAVQSSRPRGTLFFAGPTGVGKTEMAKALAALLFGHDHACARFDMSEYAQEHSDQRLLGAPPGYVGYEEGGQLANRLKENPFRVLLFDEIDKAHPRILDKFLQILDDGRMTDGRGETVYFSESIIIFTSNIGATAIDESMSPADVRKTVMAAIDAHFRRQLGRPELLNRFGNNFVVFGYITPAVADQIVERMLENISSQLRDSHALTLTLAPDARAWLTARAQENLSMGGRGIGNLIEEVVVNPLGRFLFDQAIGSRTDPERRTVAVDSIDEHSAGGRTYYSIAARVE